MAIAKQISWIRLLIGLFMLALMGAPVSAQGLQCSAPEKAWVEIDLIFGRNVGCGDLGVTEASWDKFVDEQITPKFPHGLTIINAEGQWLSKKCHNAILHEASKQVRITVPGKDAVNDKIDAIVTEYRKRFEQESVMVMTRPLCVSFCRPNVCCSNENTCPFKDKNP
jgi:hypothetical protein